MTLQQAIDNIAIYSALHNGVLDESIKVIDKSVKATEILKTVLGLNATNRAIIRQAYESGWITEEQVDLLKEVLELV